MSLDFDTTAIAEEHKAILSREHNGESYWSHEVEAVAFTGMLVGINPITEENYREWYSRYVQYQLAAGYSEWLLTLDTVHKFVGFRSNVSTVTPAAWRKKVAEVAAATALRRIEREEREPIEREEARELIVQGTEDDAYPHAYKWLEENHPGRLAGTTRGDIADLIEELYSRGLVGWRSDYRYRNYKTVTL